MPFKSAAQRKFLQANELELAEKWKKKYGYTVDAVNRRAASNNSKKSKKPGPKS